MGVEEESDSVLKRVGQPSIFENMASKHSQRARKPGAGVSICNAMQVVIHVARAESIMYKGR